MDTRHIDDDFFKRLIGQTNDEVPSAGFTNRVMANIPQTAPFSDFVDKPLVKPWQWILLAVVFAGIVYSIFVIDFGSFFNLVTTNNTEGQVDYLRMFTSVMQLFSQAFSVFKLTNISLMIAISLVTLYFGDRYLRNRTSESKQNFV